MEAVDVISDAEKDSCCDGNVDAGGNCVLSDGRFLSIVDHVVKICGHYWTAITVTCNEMLAQTINKYTQLSNRLRLVCTPCSLQ